MRSHHIQGRLIRVRKLMRMDLARSSLLALAAAALIGILIAVWGPTTQDESATDEIFNTLSDDPFPAEFLPDGYVYIESHASSAPDKAKGADRGVIYVTLDGPDDRDRIIFQFFDSRDEAFRAFDQLKAAYHSGSGAPEAKSGRVLRAPVAFSPSYCLRIASVGVECHGLLGAVMIGGESRIQTSKGASGSRINSAAIMLAGIRRLKALSDG
jgi:hypothetical protein